MAGGIFIVCDVARKEKEMNTYLTFIRQPTTAGTPMKYEFDVSGIKWLIKNFTDGDIYVAMGETTDKTDCLLIPAETSQVVTPYDGVYIHGSNIITIIPDATSEKGVEVQCLKW